MQNKLWKYLPAELAHRLAPVGLSYYSSKAPSHDFKWRPFTWKGLHFRNPVGIAGGVDKNAEHLLHWQKLGAGFLEVGTVTPYSQNPNKGKILDRDWDAGNVWNRMGFPNHGADEVYFNLRNQKPEIHVPIFVNIGKNRRRPNEEAELDYMYLAERFSNIADALVINISSPNTQGLRSLQSPKFIREVIQSTRKMMTQQIPLFVKLSPDMEDKDFRSCLEAAAEEKVEGFILTNTTLARPDGCPFPKEGGLSGAALKERSRHHLKKAVEFLGSAKSDFLIASVGGVNSRAEAEVRLSMGADLVQLYSGLVFAGPTLLTDIVEGPHATQN